MFKSYIEDFNPCWWNDGYNLLYYVSDGLLDGKLNDIVIKVEKNLKRGSFYYTVEPIKEDNEKYKVKIKVLMDPITDRYEDIVVCMNKINKNIYIQTNLRLEMYEGTYFESLGKI